MVNIDYTSEELTSATYQYDGTMGNGKKFVLHVHWNSWDGYIVEQIEWLDGNGNTSFDLSEGTREEEREIIEKYEEQMNG
jgi:hypothetical protein